MLANAVTAVLPQVGFGRLKLASANEVIESHGKDLDNPCQGCFGDLFLQEQCDFRFLTIVLPFTQGPSGRLSRLPLAFAAASPSLMCLSIPCCYQCKAP